MPEITSVYWDFGDGRSSTEANPAHAYDRSGVFFPSVTVQDSNGEISTRRWGPVFVEIDGAVTNLYYDFGDGGRSSLANPTHAWARFGEYTVSLVYFGEVLQRETVSIEDIPARNFQRSVSELLPSGIAWPADDWFSHPEYQTGTPSDPSFVPLRANLPPKQLTRRKPLFMGTLNAFAIVINRSMVSGSHSDFPAVITEACPGIDESFWAEVLSPAGLDIRLYDTDGVTELSREVVSFDRTARTLELWVRIPTLSSAADKVIYCVYGGTSRANDNIWSSAGYAGVWHLNGNANDSSGNANNGSLVNSPVSSPCKVGRGYTFASASSQMIDIPSSAGLQSVNNFTVSAWARRSVNGTVISRYNLGNWTGSNGWLGYKLELYNTVYFGVSPLSGVSRSVTYPYPGAGWHHYTAQIDNRVLKLFVDGELVDQETITFDISNRSINTTIGGNTNSAGTEYFSGDIDEVRFRNAVTPVNQILTEFNNQSNPAQFATCYGNEAAAARAEFLRTISALLPMGQAFGGV